MGWVTPAPTIIYKSSFSADLLGPAYIVGLKLQKMGLANRNRNYYYYKMKSAPMDVNASRVT